MGAVHAHNFLCRSFQLFKVIAVLDLCRKYECFRFRVDTTQLFAVPFVKRIQVIPN